MLGYWRLSYRSVAAKSIGRSSYLSGFRDTVRTREGRSELSNFSTCTCMAPQDDVPRSGAVAYAQDPDPGLRPPPRRRCTGKATTFTFAGASLGGLRAGDDALLSYRDTMHYAYMTSWRSESGSSTSCCFHGVETSGRKTQSRASLELRFRHL